MQTATATWEYRNDYFSLAIREVRDRPGSYLFCSGISIPRFDPICWGKAGICSNPAFKGLQLLRANVSLFALQRGLATRNTDSHCEPEGGHATGWYQENALLIEGASSGDIQAIFEFSSRDLVRTVLSACSPDVELPAGSLDPDAMQRFLESLSVPNYREVAPPPIAKPQAA